MLIIAIKILIIQILVHKYMKYNFFEQVLLARHKEENWLYAVKVVSKSFVVRKNEARHIMSERNVLLKNNSNPFLVGLKYSFKTTGRLYFVMDFINGGEVSAAEK